jgi:ABC-type sugar transport system ATPase subunit
VRSNGGATGGRARTGGGTTDPMSEVRLDGLRKLYDGAAGQRAARPAVDRLDLTFASGHLVVLVGPSGCGKSTTLRMVAGLEEPTDGRVWIDGRDVTRAPPAERDIAMVFQSYALYPHMTVFDNLAFALRIRKRPEAEIKARVEEVARSLDIHQFLARRPRALSGGQRQRVAIGRAVVRQPKVFLFDEPLSNLDAKLRGEMRREIARLHRAAATTSLYVTHDQVEAMTLADQIVVLKDGALQQVASPLEIYRAPANRFVAGFFGTPTMNFLELERAGDVARAAGVALPLPPAIAAAAGARVIAGARPEDVALAPGDGRVAIAGQVEVREVLGAEAVLHVTTAAGLLTVRADPREPHPLGAAVTLHLAPAAMHWFDGATERRL